MVVSKNENCLTSSGTGHDEESRGNDAANAKIVSENL